MGSLFDARRRVDQKIDLEFFSTMNAPAFSNTCLLNGTLTLKEVFTIQNILRHGIVYARVHAHAKTN